MEQAQIDKLIKENEQIRAEIDKLHNKGKTNCDQIEALQKEIFEKKDWSGTVFANTFLDGFESYSCKDARRKLKTLVNKTYMRCEENRGYFRNGEIQKYIFDVNVKIVNVKMKKGELFLIDADGYMWNFGSGENIFFEKNGLNIKMVSENRYSKMRKVLVFE